DRGRAARVLARRRRQGLVRAARLGRRRGPLGRALERGRGGRALRGDRRAGRRGRAARARRDRARFRRRVDLVRREPGRGDRGRAQPLPDVRGAGLGREPALGEAAPGAAGGRRRRLVVRLVRRRHALDRRARARLLARRGRDRDGAPGAMTAAFRRRAVQCLSPSGLHRVSYVEWGERDNPRVLVCAHGLTRCARDFDFLAAEMAKTHRVICPDVAGRGESQWLRNPMEYVVPTYVADMVTLIARLDVESVQWVGTSLGGLIGMALAAFPEGLVSRLVLNDSGPLVTAASLDRIGSYVGKAPSFPDIETAEYYVRTVSAPFGPHSDAEWRFLTEHVVRRQPDGSLRLHYDPALAVPFNAEHPHKDIELWKLYDAIRCPTLVLRGESSDL